MPSHHANSQQSGIYRRVRSEDGSSARDWTAKRRWKRIGERGEQRGKNFKETHCISTILPLKPEGAKLSELMNDGERFRRPGKRVRLGDAPVEIMLRASMEAFDCMLREKVSIREVDTLIGRDVDERDGTIGEPVSGLSKGLMLEYVEATSNAEPREDLRARARFSSRRRCWRSSRSSLRTSMCSTIMPFSNIVTSRP